MQVIIKDSVNETMAEAMLADAGGPGDQEGDAAALKFLKGLIDDGVDDVEYLDIFLAGFCGGWNACLNK